MNLYQFSSVVAFILFGMGVSAAILGLSNYLENRKSRRGKQMLGVCISVFFWDSGYAWMSMCYENDFAYVARAIALLAVTFYMFFILRYVALVVDYPKKRLRIFLAICMVISLLAWTKIIQRDAVDFVMTPWGYWYTSKMTIARLIQFGSVLAALVEYYHILSYGKRRTQQKRKQYVLKRFGLFGEILFAGYMLDTLIPTIFHIPAVPGSGIGAFASAMVLFHISKTNKTFGLSQANVAEYVFQDVNVPVVITDGEDCSI